jgi:hypothetical protein
VSISNRLHLLLVPLVVLLAAAGVTGAAASPPASTPGQVPFHATLEESVVSQGPCPAPSTFICVYVTGSGNATQLGAVRESLVVVVDTVASSSLAPDCHVERPTSTLTAANGDQLTLEGPGLNCGIDTPQGTVVDLWTVTGGTGRFQGATGSGTKSATIDELTVPVTAVSTFSGTLSR